MCNENKQICVVKYAQEPNSIVINVTAATPQRKYYLRRNTLIKKQSNTYTHTPNPKQNRTQIFKKL